MMMTMTWDDADYTTNNGSSSSCWIFCKKITALLKLKLWMNG